MSSLDTDLKRATVDWFFQQHERPLEALVDLLAKQPRLLAWCYLTAHRRRDNAVLAVAGHRSEHATKHILWLEQIINVSDAEIRYELVRKFPTQSVHFLLEAVFADPSVDLTVYGKAFCAGLASIMLECPDRPAVPLDLTRDRSGLYQHYKGCVYYLSHTETDAAGITVAVYRSNRGGYKRQPLARFLERVNVATGEADPNGPPRFRWMVESE